MACEGFGKSFELQKPTYAYQWYYVALLRRYIGDTEGCREICQQVFDAYESNPNVWALAQTARCCALLDRPVVPADRIVKLAKTACDREPGLAIFHYGLGVSLLRAGQYETALVHLRKSTEVEPHWTSKNISLPLMALAHHGLGQTKDAEETLRKSTELLELWIDEVLSKPPGYLPTHWEDWVEFQIYHREAAKKIGNSTPDDPRLAIMRARALVALGRPESGKAAFTEALAAAERYDGRNGKWLKQMSWSVVSRPQMEPDHYRAALRLVETARKLEPSNTFYFNCHGTAHYRVGNYQEALSLLSLCDQFHRLRKGHSHSADSAFLAMTHFRMGNKQEALAALDRLKKVMTDQNWHEANTNRDYSWEARKLIEGD
jgi:tetratricopeptide (TPR) repeat protein